MPRFHRLQLSRSALLTAALLTCALLVHPAAATAQPFTSWLSLLGSPSHGYVEIADHSSLNPASDFTFEAWVAISNSSSGEDCRSIAGKNWQQSW